MRQPRGEKKKIRKGLSPCFIAATSSRKTGRECWQHSAVAVQSWWEHPCPRSGPRRNSIPWTGGSGDASLEAEGRSRHRRFNMAPSQRSSKGAPRMMRNEGHGRPRSPTTWSPTLRPRRAPDGGRATTLISGYAGLWQRLGRWATGSTRGGSFRKPARLDAKTSTSDDRINRCSGSVVSIRDQDAQGRRLRSIEDGGGGDDG